jgi:hypothetical protein
MLYLSIQRKIRIPKTKTNLIPASALAFPQPTSFKPDQVNHKPASHSQSPRSTRPTTSTYPVTAIEQNHREFERLFTMTIRNQQKDCPAFSAGLAICLSSAALQALGARTNCNMNTFCLQTKQTPFSLTGQIQTQPHKANERNRLCDDQAI